MTIHTPLSKTDCMLEAHRAFHGARLSNIARILSAALLLMALIALTAFPALISPAHATSSPTDKELFCEARRMVIPYDVFSNSLIVSVRENVVTLSGYIDSDSAKRQLGESLASLKGVKKVRNSVMVRRR